jgi:hypothetical protein
MAHENTGDDPKAEIVTSIWFGLAAIRRYPGSRRRLRIRWVRVLGTVLGLGAVAWLLAALALYYFFKLDRGFQDEQFVDVLTLPFHYQAHNREMGEYFLKMGDLHLQNGRLPDAMTAFRIGVDKVPDSLHGRTILANFYYVYYRDELDHSLDILEAGLPYAVQTGDTDQTKQEHLDYINDFLLRLQQAHEPDKLQAICQQYLAQTQLSVQAHELFALNLASIYIDTGRFDEAEDIIKKYQLEQIFEGVLLESRLLWESGRLYAAPAYLENALARFPGNDYIYGLLSRYYRDLGDLDHSLTYILLREGAKPDNSEPRIERLYITAKSGDKTELSAETEELINQFHADSSTMTLLASFGTDQGDVALTRRLFDLAQAQYQVDMKKTGKSDFNLASFGLLICEAYLTNDQYRDALAYLDTLDAEKPDWLEPNRLLFDSMRAVADYGIGRLDETDMYVTSLVKSTKTRPDTLMTIANRFLSHGAIDEAQRLLYAAHRMDPHNQAILAQLISANLQLGNSAEMDKNLKDLLNTRRPPLELLYDAYRQLGTDRFTFVPDRELLLNLLDQHIREAIKMRSADSQM